jgi:peroxiredoxin
VIIFCVNDGAVMDAWGRDQGVERSSGLVTMMGDPTGSLTSALGLELRHPGPIGLGLLNRCKRFAAYIVDGTVKLLTIAERPDDPAGDDYPEITLAPAVIAAVKALGKEEL